MRALPRTFPDRRWKYIAHVAITMHGGFLRSRLEGHVFFVRRRGSWRLSFDFFLLHMPSCCLFGNDKISLQNWQAIYRIDTSFTICIHEWIICEKLLCYIKFWNTKILYMRISSRLTMGPYLTQCILLQEQLIYVTLLSYSATVYTYIHARICTRTVSIWIILYRLFFYRYVW